MDYKTVNHIRNNLQYKSAYAIFMKQGVWFITGRFISQETWKTL